MSTYVHAKRLCYKRTICIAGNQSQYLSTILAGLRIIRDIVKEFGRFIMEEPSISLSRYREW